MNTASKREPIDVHELGLRIAAHLKGWTVVPPDPDDTHPHGVRFKGPDGASLWMHADEWDGRATIGGTFPLLACGRMYSTRKEDYASIGFDVKRDARLVARDIERRCLSVYLPAYAKACAYAKDYAHNRSVALRLATTIAEHCGTEPRPQGSDGSVDVYPEVVSGCYKLTVHAGHADRSASVSMQIEGVSTSTAIRVLDVLKAAVKVS